MTVVSCVSTHNKIWRGLKIENHCPTYKRSKEYRHSPKIENRIVESLGNKIYSPYSGEYFNSIKKTEIEHVVSIREAHKSGLCFADKKTKKSFAEDMLNLTLVSPKLNKEKSDQDAGSWAPERNKCWFAHTVIRVKKKYNLTVDSKEKSALEKVISKCSSFELE